MADTLSATHFAEPVLNASQRSRPRTDPVKNPHIRGMPRHTSAESGLSPATPSSLSVGDLTPFGLALLRLSAGSTHLASLNRPRQEQDGNRSCSDTDQAL